MGFLRAECHQLVPSLAAHLKCHEAAREQIFLVLSSNKWSHKKLVEFGAGKKCLRQMAVSKHYEPGIALLEELPGRAEPEL